MTSPSPKRWNLVIAAVVAVVFAVVFFVTRKKNTPTLTNRVFRAWYARTPTPVLVVEQWTRKGAIDRPDFARTTTSAYDATTTIRYHSHRLDGTHLGSYHRDGWRVPLGGVWNDRVWVCSDKGEPALLAAEGLKPIADREAIRKAIAGGVGGDFEIRSGKCYVDEHSGRLAIDGADGKAHWVTTDLRVEERPSNSVHPPGYVCSLPTEGLIEPTLAECMAPDAGPANVLALSKASALAKDAERPPLLSGVAASNDKGARVLWTKPLTELSKQPDPFWLGAQPLAPARVAVMIRTAEMRVHVIEIDPAEGAVKASHVLFATSPPGG